MEKGYFVSPYTFADHFNRALFHFNKTGFSSYCPVQGGKEDFQGSQRQHGKLPIILYVLRVPRERPQFLYLTGICHFPRLLPGTLTPTAAGRITFYSTLSLFAS